MLSSTMKSSVARANRTKTRLALSGMTEPVGFWNVGIVSSSPLSEALGVLALRHSDLIYARARSVTRRNLAVLGEFFDRHSDQFTWVRPAGGCTAFPWLVSGRSSRDFCREAAAAGVLLAPGDLFGAQEHFRIGFGACERFNEGIERLSELAASSASLHPVNRAVR